MQLMPTVIAATVALLLFVAPAGRADAQDTRQLSLDAQPVSGALSYAWRVNDGRFAGVEVGFGFPQIDRTLRPDSDDFEEFLHLGAFYRLVPSRHVDLDVGVRGSVGDLYACGASDCWPGLFGGGYATALVGWRRVKFGSRLVAGWFGESNEPTTFVVNVTPLLVRLTLGW